MNDTSHPEPHNLTVTAAQIVTNAAAAAAIADRLHPESPVAVTLVDRQQPGSATVAATGLLQSLFAQLLAQTADTLEHLLIAVLLYAALCLLVYKLLHWRRGGGGRQGGTEGAGTDASATPLAANPAVRFPRCRRVLLVTAHPDDECMFFGPTLLALSRRRNCQVYVLCLSNGNYDRLGCQRRDELYAACEVLRVPQSNITLVQATELQDDPQLLWSAEVVARQIQRHVEQLGIDALCTFDAGGVSGHANHRAIYYAVASLFVAHLLPPRCRVLTLDTCSVLRKYVFVLDVLVTLVWSQLWVVARWPDVRRVRAAMAEHRSQMVWFRRLYVLCSRYMVLNSWREMSVSDLELEQQLEEAE